MKKFIEAVNYADKWQARLLRMVPITSGRISCPPSREVVAVFVTRAKRPVSIRVVDGLIAENDFEDFKASI